MIKTVIVDMDGTLLNDKNQITEYTVSVIKEFQENGGTFAINTGRSYTSTIKILKEAGIKCDCICLSGAAIYDDEGNCILNDTMKDSEIRIVRELERKHGLYVNYLTTHGVLSENTYENAQKHYLNEARILSRNANNEFNEEEALKKYQWILDMVQYETDIEQKINSGVQVYKMTVMSMDEEVLQAAKKEIKEYPSLIAASTFPTNFEVNASRVDKGFATIEYICYKGFMPEEAMVIGDSENDIPMFKLSFGKKIAMENADECVKQICTDVTSSNIEDGVAHAIKKWGLKD